VSDANHYRKLEHLYAAAPITRWYGATIEISDGRATVHIRVRPVHIRVRPEFLHAAAAVHGSVYFRALDDAAFFAANSCVTDVLLLTVAFNIQFTAPVREGVISGQGRMVHAGGRILVAESELRDESGRLLAKGSGTFARSRIPLSADVGYTL
jgi:uncharacterized protein (TIGR00369 family)